MHELEKKGIPAACKAHGVRPEDLGVKGCLLLYRRRIQDMPLAQPPENAAPEQIAKTERVRLKMLHLAQDKFLFRVQERRVATGLIVENGRVAGLKLAETRVEGRSAQPIPGSEYELRAPLVISSIGSVPEIIPSIAMKGEYYTFTDERLPRYQGHGRVFGVGNVVTGQGNIHASLVHSQAVTTRLIEDYMGIGSSDGNFSALYAAAEASVAGQTQTIEDNLLTLPALSPDEVAKLQDRIRTLQERAGYTSNYDSWIAKVTPPDLE
jgi:hypothetical protein